MARLYEATRPGYPAGLAEFVAATAGAGAGADDGAWVTRPAYAAAIAGSRLFEAPLHRTFSQRHQACRGCHRSGEHRGDAAELAG